MLLPLCTPHADDNDTSALRGTVALPQHAVTLCVLCTPDGNNDDLAAQSAPSMTRSNSCVARSAAVAAA